MYCVINIINLATCFGSMNHPQAGEPKNVAKFIILIIYTYIMLLTE